MVLPVFFYCIFNLLYFTGMGPFSQTMVALNLNFFAGCLVFFLHVSVKTCSRTERIVLDNGSRLADASSFSEKGPKNGDAQRSAMVQNNLHAEGRRAQQVPGTKMDTKVTSTRKEKEPATSLQVCVAAMHAAAPVRKDSLPKGVRVAWIARRFEQATFAGYESMQGSQGGEAYWASGVDYIFEHFLNITGATRIFQNKADCEEAAGDPLAAEQNEQPGSDEQIIIRKLSRGNAPKTPEVVADCSMAFTPRTGDEEAWTTYVRKLRDRFDLIILDNHAGSVLQALWSLIQQAAAQRRYRHKMLYQAVLNKLAILDFHGMDFGHRTLAPFEHSGFSLKQLMWPTDHDSPMPLWAHAQVLENELPAKPGNWKNRGRRGFLLGKECHRLEQQKNWSETGAPVIRALLKAGFELHTNADLSECEGIKEELSKRELKNLVAHGFVTVKQFRALLGSVAFVVGFGFPRNSPTPLEAMAMGAAWLNPCTRQEEDGDEDEKEEDPETEEEIAGKRDNNRAKTPWDGCQFTVPNTEEPHMYSFPIGDARAAVRAAEKAVERRFRSFVPPHQRIEAVANTMCHTVRRFLEK